MCGRFSLIASPEDIAEWFDVDEIDEFPPRYNIAPTQPILMAHAGLSGTRQVQLVRWGLVPSWVKDPKEFTLLLNARSETVAQKPSFRNAINHRRTLVPASGFYEWHRPQDKEAKKQAYWITPADGNLVFFGGLMETYASDNGSEIDTGCILTTRSNDMIGDIHHRQPVVIKPKDFDRWLDCVNYRPDDVTDLMEPVDDDYFSAIAIGDKVNKVANHGPDIQAPISDVDGNEQPNKISQSKLQKADDQFDLF